MSIQSELEAHILARLRRIVPVLFPAVLALCGVLQIVYINQPSYRTLHDDGIYLTTAKALAEGRGYVIDSLPEPMAQTKYPILFPALLAAVWKVAPESPANMPWLRLVPLVCFWGWLYMVWKLLRDELGMKERAKWIVALLASAPQLSLLVRVPMSEMPFALFSTWVVLLATRIHLDPAAPSVRRVLLLGVVCALAYHTRTAALALLPVVVLTLGRKRAWAGLAVFGIVAFGAWAPWAYWQSVHPPPSEELLRFYTHASYSDWNVFNTARVAEPMGVIVRNALAATMWIRDVWWLQLPGWLTPVYLVAAAVTARGLWRLLRGPGFAAAMWTASTAAVILLWTWPPSRFLVPVSPFLLLALTASVPTTAPAAVRALTRAAAVALVMTGMWVSSQPGEDVIWPEYALLSDWLRTNTSDRAIVAGSMDPSYWLYADRKSVRVNQYDPIRLHYQLKEERSEEEDARQLERVLQTHRVAYLVFEEIISLPDLPIVRRQVEALRATRGGLLEPVFASPSGKIQVFRVRRDRGLE